MREPTAAEIEEMRAAFFRRTRRPTIFLYGILGAVAAGMAISAISTDLVRAVLGIAVGLVVAVVAYGLAPRFPVRARSARWIVLVAGSVGLLVSFAGDGIETWVGGAGFLGALAGFLLGSLAGVARNSPAPQVGR